LSELGQGRLFLAGVLVLAAASWAPMPWLLHSLVLFASGVTVITYYWLHCAGPSLYYNGATPATMRFVRGLGMFTVASLALVTAWNVVQGHAPALLLAVMVASGVVYLTAWPLPRLVGRFFGGIDEIEADRRMNAYRLAKARRVGGE
jgi:hypothetical protein